MPDNMSVTLCHQCKARVRFPSTKTRFRCPRCQAAIVVGDSVAMEPSTEAQSQPHQATALEQTIAADTDKSAVPAAHVQNPTTLATGEETPPAIKKLVPLLQNGLVLGIVCAIGVNYLIPALGFYSVYGMNRLVICLAVAAAGYFGVLHWLYRLIVNGFATIHANQSAQPQENRLPAERGSPSNDRRTIQSAARAGGSPSRNVPKGHPVTGTSAGQEVSPRLRYPKVIGAVAGLLVIVVLSSLKPSLGQTGLSLILAGTGAIFTLVVVALALSIWAAKNRAPDCVVALVATRASITSVGVLALVVLGCGVWAEYFAPEDGLVRVALGRVSGLVNPPDQPAFVDAAWNHVTFVMVNPDHLAVGITADTSLSPGAYRLAGKVVDDDAKKAQKMAWNLKIPIIANNPSLARRIFAETDIDRLLADDIGKELLSLWTPKELLPTKAVLGMFADSRGRRRVGHILSDAPNGVPSQPEFGFVELIPTALDRAKTATSRSENTGASWPFRVEHIRLEQGASGDRPLEVLSDRDLRDYTDFLEYCLYNVFVKLQANQSRPVFLYVDDVEGDIEHGDLGLAALKSALGEKKRDVGVADNNVDTAMQKYFEGGRREMSLLDFLITRVTEAELEKQRQVAMMERLEEKTDVVKLLEAEIAELKTTIGKLRTIVDQEHRLTSEIRGKLVRGGIPLVERSDRALDIMRTKVSGTAWLRPEANDEIVESGLATASHILLTQIRTPDVSGRYQLSMRLVDVEKGTILWEDQGDREKHASLSETR